MTTCITKWWHQIRWWPEVIFALLVFMFMACNSFGESVKIQDAETTTESAVSSFLWGGYRDILLYDSVAMCALVNGIEVIQFHAEGTTSIISRYPLEVSPSHLGMNEDRLFVVVNDGVVVFNITEDYTLDSLLHIDIGKPVTALGFIDNALLALSRDGLRVVESASAQVVGILPLDIPPGFYRPSIQSIDGRVLVSAGDLWLVDCSEPGNPVILSTYRTVFSAGQTAVIGDRIYVGDQSHNDPPSRSSLLVLGVDATDSLILANRIDLVGGIPDVDTVRGNLVICADIAGFGIWSVADPDNPIPIWCHEPLGNTSSATASGDQVLVRSSIIEFGASSEPYYNHCRQVSGSSDPVRFTGVSAGDLILIDVSDPTDAQQVGSHHAVGRITSTCNLGPYIFAGDARGAIYVEDVSRTDQLGPVAYVETNYSVNSLAISDSVLCTGTVDGIEIYHWSQDSLDLSQSSILFGQTVVYDVEIVGNYLLAAAGVIGVLVIDISEPQSPVFSYRLPTNDFAASIAVDTDYIYVADRYAGVLAVPVAELPAPSTTNRFLIDQWIVFISVDDSTIVGAGASHVYVGRLSPSGDFQPMVDQESNNIRSVTLDKGTLYLSRELDGIDAYCISSTDGEHRLECRVTIPTPGFADGVFLLDSCMIIEDSYSLLRKPNAQFSSE